MLKPGVNFTNVLRATFECPRINFINIIRTALKRADHKSVKKTVKLSILFMLLGSKSVKTAHKTLVKLTTDLKSAKRHWWLDCLFALFGALQIKAACKRVGEINHWLLYAQSGNHVLKASKKICSRKAYFPLCWFDPVFLNHCAATHKCTEQFFRCAAKTSNTMYVKKYYFKKFSLI